MATELRLVFVFAIAALAIEYVQAKELKEVMLALRQKRQSCGPACGPVGCCGPVCCAPPPPPAPCCAPPQPAPAPCCLPPPPPPPPCCPAPPPCPPACQPACVPACVATCASGGCGRKRRALRAARNLATSGEAQNADEISKEEEGASNADITKKEADDWGYGAGSYGTVGGAYGTSSGYGGSYGSGGYGSGGYGGGYGINSGGYIGQPMICRQC